ncbi:MAG: type VI secretion system baseplate subunit TssF [Desulfovibrionaceae bacterium]|nr:type VI secretion system baseplate subunit TssF [Desulfovibrionaceae bacterium]
MERYYRDQLQRLHEGAHDFARRHPAIAPMMLTESSDPDVERILEGTAWLCAKIQQRLDQTAPNLIQALLRLVFPQAILPIPSTTLIRFDTEPSFAESIFLPTGTQIASNPVDGISCIYSTSQDLQILPLIISDVTLLAPNATSTTVTITLGSWAPLKNFLPSKFILYCTGSYAKASERFLALLTRTLDLTVQTTSQTIKLPKNAIRHQALPLTDIRLPGNRKNHRGYLELLRYFHFPEQLLAIEIDGLDNLPLDINDTELKITFRLKGSSDTIPNFSTDSFAINVVPAANVFRVPAEPITVDHTRSEYLIRPQNGKQNFMEIVAVEDVTAMFSGGRTYKCKPYEAFDPDDEGLFYSLRYRKSEKDGSIEHLLAPLYRTKKQQLASEHAILSIDLLCTNHSLPGSLKTGDICLPTDSSPVQATFTNLMAPAPMLPRPTDESLLWRFLSLMNANLLSLASPEALRSLLQLYLPNKDAAFELAAADVRRVQAVANFSSSPEERLFGGRLLRGRLLALTLDPVGFVSKGDLYLFANALDRFFAEFTNLNTYSRLQLTIGATGEELKWPPRLGEKQLI